MMIVEHLQVWQQVSGLEQSILSIRKELNIRASLFWVQSITDLFNAYGIGTSAQLYKLDLATCSLS